MQVFIRKDKSGSGSQRVSLATLELENQKLRRLIELGTMLGQQSDFHEILRLVTQKAASLLHADTASIMMINPRTRETVKTILMQGHQYSQRQLQEVQTHLSGWIIKNKKRFVSANLKTDPQFRKHLFKDSPIDSALGVPFRCEGIILGTLLVFKQKVWRHSIEEDLSYLEKFATIAAPHLRNVQKIQEYFEVAIPETALRTKYKALGLLGKSRKFIELLKAIEAVARCDVRVLLEGQSGTGKELVARAIHRFSARHDHAFVAIDCGAIPENLIESELFGHIKGAFTSAATDRKGLLEEANEGTLFMDEIANLPLDMQVKLMRVLQEGEVRPLGSNQMRKVNVRVISASSAPLRQLVDDQKFREDLFYRLHVYPIQVPSLDDRQEDIPLLANHFLRKLASQQRKQAESFHEETLDFMKQRHWGGNIRELENFVERLLTHASKETPIIHPDVLPPDLRREIGRHKASQHQAGKSLHDSLSEYEEQLIRGALKANNWNQSRTARILKISEQTLRYKMAKLSIANPKSQTGNKTDL